jgi:hypothetical protein
MDLKTVLEQSREKAAKTTHKIDRGGVLERIMLDLSRETKEEDGKNHGNNVHNSNNDSDCDIAFCFAQDSINFAVILNTLLETRMSDMDMGDMSFISSSSQERLQHLEKAKKIVVFLSTEFVSSPQHMHELHISLCRQRAQKTAILYIIQATELPDKPTFLHLIPCTLGMLDTVWRESAKSYLHNRKRPDSVRNVVSTNRDFHGSYTCGHHEFFALTKAADDIVESLTSRKK